MIISHLFSVQILTRSSLGKSAGTCVTTYSGARFAQINKVPVHLLLENLALFLLVSVKEIIEKDRGFDVIEINKYLTTTQFY